MSLIHRWPLTTNSNNISVDGSGKEYLIDGLIGHDKLWSCSPMVKSLNWVAFNFSSSINIKKLRLYPSYKSYNLGFKDGQILCSNNSTNGVDGDWVLMQEHVNMDDVSTWHEFYVKKAKKNKNFSKFQIINHTGTISYNKY